MQDKINYAGNLLKEMPLRENGEADEGRAISLQSKIDPEGRKEGEEKDWMEASSIPAQSQG